MRAINPVTDLCDTPENNCISQLLFGEPFAVEKTEGAYSFGQMACGYQGWLPSAALAAPRTASHFVSAMATYIYARPDIKSEVRLRIPFLAQVKVLGQEGQFSRAPEGFVFSDHLNHTSVKDFVAVAERFLGVPYLWGGRSSLGIDCSGLAQMALHAAGVKAPRDSGPQSMSVGAPLPLDAPLVRGDLVFWKGHVGLMQDAKTLLHATAFSMSVITEPLATTAARVKAQGFGGITAIRRFKPI